PRDLHSFPTRRSSDLLERLGVPRGDSVPDEAETALVRVPNVQNLPVAEAEAVLRAAGLVPAYDGSGTYVLDQTPVPGARVPAGTAVALDFWEVPDHWRGPATVPDVRGLTLRQAAETL